MEATAKPRPHTQGPPRTGPPLSADTSTCKRHPGAFVLQGDAAVGCERDVGGLGASRFNCPLNVFQIEARRRRRKQAGVVRKLVETFSDLEEKGVMVFHFHAAARPGPQVGLLYGDARRRACMAAAVSWGGPCR